MRPVARLAALLLLGLLGGCEEGGPPIADNLTLGEPFPAMALVDLESAPRDLQVPAGKLTIINVWATWCESCRWEMPDLQWLADRLDGERFALVGVSVNDEVYLAREYLLDRSITFPNFVDLEGKVTRGGMGMSVLPYTFFVSVEGKLLHRIAGSRRWRSEQVLQALEAAYGGDYHLLRRL